MIYYIDRRIDIIYIIYTYIYYNIYMYIIYRYMCVCIDSVNKHYVGLRQWKIISPGAQLRHQVSLGYMATAFVYVVSCYEPTWMEILFNCCK